MIRLLLQSPAGVNNHRWPLETGRRVWSVLWFRIRFHTRSKYGVRLQSQLWWHCRVILNKWMNKFVMCRKLHAIDHNNIFHHLCLFYYWLWVDSVHSDVNSVAARVYESCLRYQNRFHSYTTQLFENVENQPNQQKFNNISDKESYFLFTKIQSFQLNQAINWLKGNFENIEDRIFKKSNLYRISASLKWHVPKLGFVLIYSHCRHNNNYISQ